MYFLIFELCHRSFHHLRRPVRPRARPRPSSAPRARKLQWCGEIGVWTTDLEQRMEGKGRRMFPKIRVGTTKSWNFNRDFHYKPSILGYHYFWKHPETEGKQDDLPPWNSKKVLKIGHPKRTQSYWNHPFSGSMLVFGGVCRMIPFQQFTTFRKTSPSINFGRVYGKRWSLFLPVSGKNFLLKKKESQWPMATTKKSTSQPLPKLAAIWGCNHVPLNPPLLYPPGSCWVYVSTPNRNLEDKQCRQFVISTCFNQSSHIGWSISWLAFLVTPIFS